VKTDIEQFFGQVDGLMAGLSRVSAYGFFSEFNASLNNGFEDSGIHFTLKATGYIPNKAEDQLVGVSPYIDAEEIFVQLKHQVTRGEAQLNVQYCEVKISEWPKYTLRGNRKGVRGQEISFTLNVGIKNKRKKR
jgi:hypothetical protein